MHLLRNSECRAALSVLADHVPAGSRLAFAGRDEPPLRVARLRAEGKILEIGPDDLSLTRGEAEALLRAAEVMVGDDDMARLHERTEGWAAGLYLAALYLREGGSPQGAAASFGGDDRFVSQYVESEFMARISSSQRAFLTRTAVLERMCGPLCEAVLDVPGSAAALQHARHQYHALDNEDARADRARVLFLLLDILIGSFRSQLLALDDRLGEIQLGMLRGASPEVHDELVQILGVLTDGIQEFGWYSHDLEEIAETVTGCPACAPAPSSISTVIASASPG